MKIMKHTPGPWVVRKHPQLGAFVEAKIDGKPYGQEILGEDYWPELDREADCYLVAAAPDMLDALKESERTLQLCWEAFASQNARKALKIVCAAIAKATGQQPTAEPYKQLLSEKFGELYNL